MINIPFLWDDSSYVRIQRIHEPAKCICCGKNSNSISFRIEDGQIKSETKCRECFQKEGETKNERNLSST